MTKLLFLIQNPFLPYINFFAISVIWVNLPYKFSRKNTENATQRKALFLAPSDRLKMANFRHKKADLLRSRQGQNTSL